MTEIILTEEFLNEMASRCSEAMTLHLLNLNNPDNDSCGCMNCLSKICVELIAVSLLEEIEEQIMDDEVDEIYNTKIGKQKVDRKNIN